MRRSSYITLVISVAVAFSTGGLIRPPMPKGLAPGAYSDIVIVQNEVRGEKSATPDRQMPPAQGSRLRHGER